MVATKQADVRRNRRRWIANRLQLRAVWGAVALISLCLTGCMPADRSAQAERIAAAAAELPGVERAYASYHAVHSSGRRLTVQITVTATVTKDQLLDAWKQVSADIAEGGFEDQEVYVTVGRCLKSPSLDVLGTCQALCPPAVDTPNLKELSPVDGCSYLAATGRSGPPEFDAWLKTWQR